MKKNTIKEEKKNIFSRVPLSLWLVIIAFILYANTLKNGYNFDDNFVAYNNPTIEKGIAAIPEIFTSHYSNEKKDTFGYRPIVRSTFAVEYSLWGNSPEMSHLVSILFYCLSIFISYKVIRKIFPEFPVWILFSAFVLFTVHPIHTEAVASLKNREEILVFLFGFMSIDTFLKFADSYKWYWYILGYLLFFITCLTKENGISFAAIIPLSWYYYIRPGKISFSLIRNKLLLPIISCILLLIIAVIAYKIPSWILPQEQKTLFYFENPLHFIQSSLVHYATGFFCLLYYIKLLLFPFPLLFYYGYNQIEICDFSNIYVWFSIIIYSGILILVIKNIHKNPVFSFGILFFVFSLFILSNFLIPINGIIAERFLFIPSLGFFLAVFAVIHILMQRYQAQTLVYKKQKNKILWVVVVISIIFSIHTISRNNDWKDYKTLMAADISYLDHSAKAQTSYATVLLNELKDSAAKGYPANPSDLEKILYHYRRSLDIYPDMYSSMNNIGFIYLSFYHDPKQAIPWFKKALQKKYDHTEANYNLAFSYLKINDTLNAMKYYYNLLKIDSTHIQSISDLANIRFSQKDTLAAEQLNKQIMKIDTVSDLPYINLGNYALLSHDTSKAVEWWEKALNKNPNNPKLCNGLSNYFIQHGQTEKGNYYYNLLNRIRR